MNHVTARSIEYKPRLNCPRWVAYFDILGTQALIQRNPPLAVFLAYQRALEEVTRNKVNAVQTFWFSDSFIFYTQNTSAVSFSAIEHVTRRFCHFMIQGKVPVRGALSAGLMYADAGARMHFGNGLIEAYKYGESQNWIGYIQTPSAVHQLESLRLPTSSLNYAHWPVPFKKNSDMPKTSLPACLFAGATDSEMRRSCLNKLEQMKIHAPNDDKFKYSNALRFHEKNLRYIRPNHERPLKSVLIFL